MKLTKSEIAWKKRKAQSHPTYDQFGKYAGSLEDRMKKVKAICPYSEEGQKRQEESRKKYGAWWLFTDNKMQKVTSNNWIMQFYVAEGITNK